MITIEPPSSQPAIDAAMTLSVPALARFLSRARIAVGLDGEVGVLIAGDRALRRLNRQFRGKNKATDVLSFPAPAVEQGGLGNFAGDLAISLDTALVQAERFGHTLRDEVKILLLHGLLHLQGLDHEADRGEMAAREDELRRRFRLPGNLIARTHAATGTGRGQP